MDYQNLPPEVIEKARACKTGEELSALAAEVGVKLSDEELDSMSGGSWTCDDCSGYTPPNYGCDGHACYHKDFM